jgi:2-dehydropantoate 2-reductase
VGVVGVGAIGGYVAAVLANAGHHVVPCARRPFDQLVIEDPGHRLVVPLRALTDPAAASEVDWVVLATKANQTDAASAWFVGLCGPRTTGLLVLQNGIGTGARVEPLVSPVPVIPTVVLCGAELIAPGRVRHHGSAALRVPVEWAPEVAELFAATPIAVDPVHDFATAAWRKLVLNATSCPITALTMRRLEVFRDPAIARLALDLATECVEVARAAGAGLGPDEALAVVELLRAQPPTMGTSMLYDRLAGRVTEHEALCGMVVETGRRLGVATPRNESMLGLLRALRPCEPRGPDPSSPDTTG